VLKKVSKSVCISTAVLPDPSFPIPSTSSAVKAQEKQKRTLIALNKEMKDSLGSCAAQVKEQ
jgi:hypothetical protein